MKAHVATEGEACEPTVIKGLSEDDWEMLHDLGVSMTELDVVSTMSLKTAVFTLQQIELHLADSPQLSGRGPVEPDLTRHIEALQGTLSRVRILAISALVSLGVLGDLPTGEDGKPEPVKLPSLGFADQQDTLRRLTAERESRDERG